MLQPIKVTIDDAHLLWGLSKWITYHKPECVAVLKQSLIDCNLWIIDNLDLKEDCDNVSDCIRALEDKLKTLE